MNRGYSENEFFSTHGRRGHLDDGFGAMRIKVVSDTVIKYVSMCILVLLLLVPSTAIAVPAAEALLSAAKKYYYGVGTRQNYYKSFKLYRKAAEAGSVDAMFIVGGMYMQGQGTAVNEDEALKWLYRAAINGRSSKESERILAQSFMAGRNVPQNYNEALHWYERAANKGDAEAQSELGFLYFSGKMVAQDYRKAYRWFGAAARNNFPLAQYNLGILWYTGNGVAAVDLVKAYAWFNLADSNGHGNGGAAKRFLETVLSVEELKKAQQLSTELYRELKHF